MKNLKMVINFDVNGLNYQNQEEFINDVRNTLSSNKNLNFDLKSENVFDLSSIDTIDKAIAYRKAIVDSYVEKESFLDKFNKFLDANVKPLINNLKEDYNQYMKLQQGDFKNHLNYISAVIKNTMENGLGNVGNYDLKKDFYEAQAQLYGEYKLYKDTAYNERYWDKQFSKNNAMVEKQASEYIKNISANTWDEIEIQVDNSNRKELANIMSSMQQNPKLDYGNKTQFENSYVLDKGEGVIKLRISHNDFKQVYSDMFEKGGFTDSKYNNIKLAFLDSNIKNNEIIKNSVNVAQINNMGEKQAIINNEMTNKLVKKDQFEMRRGM